MVKLLKEFFSVNMLCDTKFLSRSILMGLEKKFGVSLFSFILRSFVITMSDLTKKFSFKDFISSIKIIVHPCFLDLFRKLDSFLYSIVLKDVHYL